LLNRIEKLTVNNLDLYIADSHNQVLEAWEPGISRNVFSLDYHTDTRPAFQNYSYWRADSEVNAGLFDDHGSRMEELTDQKIRDYLEQTITLEQVNDNLKHDEHIDFAVRTNLIDRAFILSKSGNESSSNPNVHLVRGGDEYNDQRIIEYSPLCIPGCLKEVHDEECLQLRADSALENSFLNRAVGRAEQLNNTFFDKYILDIDCDYFNTERSLYPEECSTFRDLIRYSDLITIALEPECVEICRQEGNRLSSEIILERLISIIESV